MNVHTQPPLILASASPRRRDLLRGLGVDFTIEAAAIDERPLVGELARDYVQRIADAKAQAVVSRHAREPRAPCVLAADTIVAVDNTLLGKPVDRDDALRMLALLSARTHDVLTAVVVRQGTRMMRALSHTRVTFRALGDAERRAYVDSGEPMDKAGAYGIQGLGGIFAERVQGSFTGVVGLPVAETRCLLREFGIDVH